MILERSCDEHHPPKHGISSSTRTVVRHFPGLEKHSEATRAKATVSRKAGGKFTAFDGMLAGRNLVIVPHRLIVQAWRATHWKKSDEGSILILKFSGNKTRGRIDLVHVNVPDHDYLGVKKGWPHYYWKPWRKYLERTR